MPRVLRPTALAVGILLAMPAAVPAAVIVTFDLQPTGVTATTTTFDVRLAFPGGPGDTIEAIQLSVAGSSPLLTSNGTDFSRFAFTPDAGTLLGWIELAPVSGAGGVGLYAPADPIAGPFLGPSASPASIGTLTVGLAGLPGGAAVSVSLAGGAPGLGTDAGGTLGGSFVPSFAAAGPGVAGVQFANPNGVGVTVPGSTQAVPGPASAACLAAALAALAGGRSARRRTA